MKKLYILFVLLFSMAELKPQTTQLNQVELMKQFLGSWNCDISRNTSYRYEITPFGDGMLSTVEVIVDGNVIDSIKQIYGYDAKTDKFILSEILKSTSEVEISNAWFTSEKSGTIITNEPVYSVSRIDFEFQSPDIIKQAAVLDNNYTLDMTLYRIKK